MLGLPAILLPPKSAQPEGARQINALPHEIISLESSLELRSVRKALSSNSNNVSRVANEQS